MSKIKKSVILLCCMIMSFTAAVLLMQFKPNGALAATAAPYAKILGAEIKCNDLNDDETGLRFIFVVNKTESAADFGENFANVKQMGLLAIPKDMLDGELTVETTSASKTEFVVNGQTVEQNKINSANILENNKYELAQDGDTYLMAIYFYNIPQAAYNRDLVCVGYYQLDGDVVYTDPVERSVSYVARKAYDDAAYGDDVDLKAVIESYLLDYTVTYETTGSAVSSEQVEYGKPITSAPTSALENYEFVGWTANGELVDFSKFTVTNDVTLTAKFLEVQELSLEGGAKELAVLAKDADADITVELPDGVEGEVTSVAVGGDKVANVSYAVDTRTLTVPAASVASVKSGEQTIKLYTDTAVYTAPVLVADYVITSASEFTSTVTADEINSASSGKYYILGNDITNFGNYEYHPNDGSSYEFKGTFDGRGHVISDINLTGMGLFKQLSASAIVKDFALKNATANVYGVLVGINYGTIDNVYLSANVTGGPGALVGNSPSGTINNVIVNVPTASGAYVNANYYGLISGTPGETGGGSSLGNNCYGVSPVAAAMMTSTAGWGNGEKIKTNLYGTSENLLKAFDGTLPVGFNDYWKLTAKNQLYFGETLVESYVLSETLTLPADKHELFSFAKVTTDTANYVANNMNGTNYVVTIPAQVAGEITGVTIGATTINGFSYDIGTNKLSIPVSEVSVISSGDHDIKLTTATAIYSAPVVVADYVITTAAEYMAIMPSTEMANGGYGLLYVLGNDIENFGEYNYHTGSTQYEFKGTFDGRGYYIEGIDVKGYGLFRQLSYYGTIKNIALINATNSMDNGAILVGWNYGTIDNVYVQGNSSGQGGIVMASGTGWQAPAPGVVTNSIANVNETHSSHWWISQGRGVVTGSGATDTNVYGISTNYNYVTGTSGDAPYRTDTELLTAFNGTIPSGFNGYWTLNANGDLCFGGNVIIAKA